MLPHRRELVLRTRRTQIQNQNYRTCNAKTKASAHCCEKLCSYVNSTRLRNTIFRVNKNILNTSGSALSGGMTITAIMLLCPLLVKILVLVLLLLSLLCLCACVLCACVLVYLCAVWACVLCACVLVRLCVVVVLVTIKNTTLLK